MTDRKATWPAGSLACSMYEYFLYPLGLFIPTGDDDVFDRKSVDRVKQGEPVMVIATMMVPRSEEESEPFEVTMVMTSRMRVGWIRSHWLTEQ